MSIRPDDRTESGEVWPPRDFEEDPRYAVAHREALWAIGYWLVFTIVITGIAWGLGGNEQPDVDDFVLGFPAWFFWSCLVAAGALSLVPVLIVRRWFTDVSLEATDPDRAITGGER